LRNTNEFWLDRSRGERNDAAIVTARSVQSSAFKVHGSVRRSWFWVRRFGGSEFKALGSVNRRTLNLEQEPKNPEPRTLNRTRNREP
jgi:hypothetical protein